MYKVCVYIPQDSLEKVKLAMFAAGAGRVGKYDCCAWQVVGSGQFKALAGSDPSVGSVGELENVVEYKVEMVCADGAVGKVIVALISAHPYEEPAYQYWPVNQPL